MNVTVNLPAELADLLLEEETAFVPLQSRSTAETVALGFAVVGFLSNAVTIVVAVPQLKTAFATILGRAKDRNPLLGERETVLVVSVNGETLQSLARGATDTEIDAAVQRIVADVEAPDL